MVTHDVYRSVSDPIRRSILELLARSRLTVSELAGHFEVSRPAISRHLRVLREAGVVSEVRSGRERIYRIELDELERAAGWLARIAAGLPGEEAPEEVSAEARETATTSADGTATDVEEPSGADWRQW